MRKALLALAISMLLAACSHSWRIQRRSNMMSYLYPDEGVTAAPKVGEARLQLPLRIGIAFVPAEPAPERYRGSYRTLIPANAEKELIDVVKKAFQGREWVSDIIAIPSAYLQPRGGFDNLGQVARLMNVDVIALVSVDQIQVSDPRRLSFLYVSIIGAYTLPLDRNETRTLIDAAVFHVPTRTFLLRAPGSSTLTGMSTAVDVEAKLRERSVRGLKDAMGDLAQNLNTEVDAFKASVASGERRDVDIYTNRGMSVRQSGGGGGDFGLFDAVLAAVFGLAAIATLRRR